MNACEIQTSGLNFSAEMIKDYILYEILRYIPWYMVYGGG